MTLPKDILELIVKLADQTNELEKARKENKKLKKENTELTNTVREHISEIYRELCAGCQYVINMNST